MTSNAYAAYEKGESLKPFTYKKPKLGPFDVEVAISYCGICHSDIHLIDNDWQMTKYPLVPGHEIIGEITALGSDLKDFSIGERIGIGWQRASCMHCAFCNVGEENLCLFQEATCVGHHGGFADTIVADGRFAFKIPKSLSSENAAPLLCGGATVFSPFLEHKVKPTSHVGIIGIGGLGHLAVQFAKAFGCQVTALSHSKEKEKEAKNLGAHHFLASDDKNGLKKAFNQFDFLLSTIAAPLDWNFYLNLLKPKGILCFVGVQAAPLQIQTFSLISGRKQIVGSNIASRPDLDAMLSFAAQHGIQAQTEVFAFKDVNSALDKVRSGKIRYRAVLKI